MDLREQKEEEDHQVALDPRVHLVLMGLLDLRYFGSGVVLLSEPSCHTFQGDPGDPGPDGPPGPRGVPVSFDLHESRSTDNNMQIGILHGVFTQT